MPHTQRSKRYHYLTIPIIYCLIIIGLLFLQFSGKLTIRKTIDQLTMVGTLLPGYDETGNNLSKAEIHFRGLIFTFSQERSILLQESTDSASTAPLIAYEKKEESIELSFAQNIAVRFRETQNNNLEITLQIPSTVADLQNIFLPISFFPEVHASIQQRSTETLALQHRGVEYLLVLPPGSTINTERERIQIPSEYRTGMIHYTQITSDLSRKETELIISEAPEVNEENYNLLLGKYLDKAFEGWTVSRYNGGSGTWEMYGIPAQFSEEIVVASLAEAWNRGEIYTETFNKMRRAATLHPESVTFLSAPFLGNLREVLDDTRVRHSRRARQISESIQSRDLSLLESPDLFHFVVFHGGQNLRDALLSMLISLDWQSLPMPAAIGLLQAYQSRNLFPTNVATQIARVRGVLENIILKELLLIQDSVFIETDPNEVDILLSIKVGALIQHIGDEEDNADLTKIGKGLVLSGLLLADELGFIPYSLFLGTTTAESSEYRFGPELIYPFLTENSSYPHYVSLEETGAWGWTVSVISNIQLSENIFTLSVSGPIDQTHFLIFQGIPQFSEMNLFGLTWRNDPTFEFYVRGRYYNSETDTLMIKYNDSLQTRPMIFSLNNNEGASDG